MNLIEGLLYELNRNRELLKAYEDIGPSGQFGAMFIRQAIRRAEEVMGPGDLVAMVKCCAALKESE